MTLTSHSSTRRLLYPVLILSSCIVHYTANSTPVTKDETPEISPPVTLINGNIAIRLSVKQIELAAFKMQTLDSTHYQPQHIVTGKVFNIQPLLELRSGLQNTTIRLNNARQQERIARIAYQRAQQLAEEGITSIARSAKLKQAWLTQRASLQAHQSKLDFLKLSARQQWGNTLARAIVENNLLFRELSSRQKTLVLISVPLSLTKLDSIKMIEISPNGQRQDTISAKLLSESPFNNSFAGNGFFYVAETNKLAIDKRITAWIPGQRSDIGVLIPESAIIWRNATPWVYLQLDDQTFVRHPVYHYHQVNQHWFVHDQDLSGKRIVVSGSAVLLSEELRAQIPDEDDE